MSFDFGGSAGGAPGGSGSDPFGGSLPPGPSRSTGGFSDPATPVTPAPAGSPGAGPPLVWLVLGVAAALVAVGVHLTLGGFWPGLGGWFLGGPVVIGLLAVYVTTDTARRADPWYAESALAPWGRRVLVLLSLVAVGLNAWSMADFVARGGF